MHQGVRDLIELGTIELLGKLAKAPYQRCLQAEASAPGALQTDEGRFEDLSEEQRVRFAQQRLAGLADPADFERKPYYNGPVNGITDNATRDAIARYRLEKCIQKLTSIPSCSMNRMISSKPDWVFRLENTKGRSPRILRASRSMTSKDAPT